MKNRIKEFAAFTFAVLSLLASGHAQMMTVSGHIYNSARVPLSNGTISFEPMTAPQYGNPAQPLQEPLSYSMPNGGQSTASPVVVSVPNGSFSVPLPNTLQTNPQNVCFRTRVKDSSGAEVQGYGYLCVQPSTQAAWCDAGAMTCDFDKYTPSTRPLVIQNVAGTSQNTNLSPSAGTSGTVQASDGANGLQALTSGQIATNLARSGTAFPLSPDGNTGGGQNGLLESFYGDATCAAALGEAGNTLPQGWSYGAGFACLQGGIAPATTGKPFEMLRGLGFSGESFGQAAHYGMQAGAYVDFTNNEFVGWNAAPQNSLDSTKRIGISITNAGFNMVNGSQTTLVWGTQGNNSGTKYGTDSGPNIFWAAPGAGPFQVSEFFPGDGTLILSFMGYGTIQHATSFRIPVTPPTCSSPCGSLQGNYGLQNIEISGSALNDRIGPVAEIDGGASTRTISYDIPHRTGYENIPAMLRWALHGDGSECKYDGTDSGCYDVFAWIPPNYDVHGGNRWIIQMHGFGESGLISLYRDFDSGGANVADYLFQQGYVIVTLDNTFFNCYGSPQCVADVQHVITKLKSTLALAPQPYLMADSMGGFQLFNAIAQGAVVPKAALCYSCAISLSYSYNDQPGGSGLIQAAYGFPSTAQYASATAGYDPMVAATSSSVYQARLAAVPTLLIADPADPTVNASLNSQAYAAAITAAGGNATWFKSSGGHVGPQEMNGPQALNFLNAHRAE